MTRYPTSLGRSRRRNQIKLPKTNSNRRPSIDRAAGSTLGVFAMHKMETSINLEEDLAQSHSRINPIRDRRNEKLVAKCLFQGIVNESKTKDS